MTISDSIIHHNLGLYVFLCKWPRHQTGRRADMNTPRMLPGSAHYLSSISPPNTYTPPPYSAHPSAPTGPMVRASLSPLIPLSREVLRRLHCRFRDGVRTSEFEGQRGRRVFRSGLGGTGIYDQQLWFMASKLVICDQHGYYVASNKPLWPATH